MEGNGDAGGEEKVQVYDVGSRISCKASFDSKHRKFF